MTTNKLKQLNSFLEDVNKNLNEAPETEVGHEVPEPSYVTPSIEIKLSKEKRQVCRDILLEIRNFGVSQRQMTYLIYLMALELEDQAAMKAITSAVSTHRDNIPLTKDDVPAPAKKKLIIK